MKAHTNYEEVLRRHALPEVLFRPDIALALGISVDEAEDEALAGRFGPHFFVAGRVAVLRQDFLDALAQCAEAHEQRKKEALQRGLRTVREEDRDGR